MYKKSHIPKLGAILPKLGKVAVEAVNRELHGMATEERDLLKSRIERQWFPAFLRHPLSREWVAEKTAAGASPLVMVATRHYLDSILVVQDGDAIYVGFASDAVANDLQHKPTTVRLLEVATTHEYGSQAHSLPARPHWWPHFETMLARVKEFDERVSAAITAAITAKLEGAI